MPGAGSAARVCVAHRYLACGRLNVPSCSAGRCSRSTGVRNGWEVSLRAKAQGGVPQRLRVSFRTAVGDLRLFEAGVDHAAEYRDTGLAGFRYILSQQTSAGVFGYPYNPHPAGKVQQTMLAVVREGERRGRKMVEGDWCIDDLWEGGLQFDNGEAGSGLLYAYALTGDRQFLDAARRAAEWAIGRPLVANWNYNSFSGWLLARLYRVTGQRKYLDAATDAFEFGVLPGQMENGRWLDPHNARPQYHSIMARNLVEYWLALRQAGDTRAGEVRRRTELALDSLAEETVRFGPSIVEEGLPLESLVLGLTAFGPDERWERAAHAYAHHLVDRLLPQWIESGKYSGPETLPAYVLWRKVCAGQRRGARYRSGSEAHDGLSQDRRSTTILDGAADARASVAAADRFEIEQTVISLPATQGATPGEFRANNDRVLQAMREYPGRLLGQCFVDPRHSRGAR